MINLYFSASSGQILAYNEGIANTLPDDIGILAVDNSAAFLNEDGIVVKRVDLDTMTLANL